MKHALTCIINAICGKACPSGYIGPSPEYPTEALTGFKVPQCRGEAWVYVSHDLLRKDICGGTVHAEERTPDP